MHPAVVFRFGPRRVCKAFEHTSIPGQWSPGSVLVTRCRHSPRKTLRFVTPGESAFVAVRLHFVRALYWYVRCCIPGGGVRTASSGSCVIPRMRGLLDTVARTLIPSKALFTQRGPGSFGLCTWQVSDATEDQPHCLCAACVESFLIPCTLMA